MNRGSVSSEPSARVRVAAAFGRMTVPAMSFSGRFSCYALPSANSRMVVPMRPP